MMLINHDITIITMMMKNLIIIINWNLKNVTPSSARERNDKYQAPDNCITLKPHQKILFCLVLQN